MCSRGNSPLTRKTPYFWRHYRHSLPRSVDNILVPHACPVNDPTTSGFGELLQDKHGSVGKFSEARRTDCKDRCCQANKFVEINFTVTYSTLGGKKHRSLIRHHKDYYGYQRDPLWEEETLRFSKVPSVADDGHHLRARFCIKSPT